jgi:biotin synthase
MTEEQVDATPETIAALARRVLAGGHITRAEALRLFDLESAADIFDLIAWANRIASTSKATRFISVPSSTRRPAPARRTAVSARNPPLTKRTLPRYGFVDPDPVRDAADEANRNGVTAVGLVAAWKGLKEGPMLDEVCDRIRDLAATGKTRPDASLGIIKSQAVADRLKEAGLECYGHNLESSKRFFPKHCTTHTYEDRVETDRLLEKRRHQDLLRRHHRHGRDARRPL